MLSAPIDVSRRSVQALAGAARDEGLGGDKPRPYRMLGKSAPDFQIKTLILLAILVLALSLALADTALAHTVYVSGYVEGDNIQVEAYFGKNRPVKGGRVTVLDPSGRVLVQGETDDQGLWSFKIPQRTDLKLVIEAGMGHRGEFLINKEELPETSPGPGHQPAAPKPSAEPASAKVEAPAAVPASTGIQDEQLARIVGQALDRRLKPIHKALAGLQKERGPDFRDILGGLGYIFGLMGLVMYFLRRKKNN